MSMSERCAEPFSKPHEEIRRENRRQRLQRPTRLPHGRAHQFCPWGAVPANGFDNAVRLFGDDLLKLWTLTLHQVTIEHDDAAQAQIPQLCEGLGNAIEHRIIPRLRVSKLQNGDMRHLSGIGYRNPHGALHKPRHIVLAAKSVMYNGGKGGRSLWSGAWRRAKGLQIRLGVAFR